MKITKSRLVEIIKEEAASYNGAPTVEEGVFDFLRPSSTGDSAEGDLTQADLIKKALHQSQRITMDAIQRMTEKFNKRIAAIEAKLNIESPKEPKEPDDTAVDPRYGGPWPSSPRRAT